MVIPSWQPSCWRLSPARQVHSQFQTSLLSHTKDGIGITVTVLTSYQSRRPRFSLSLSLPTVLNRPSRNKHRPRQRRSSSSKRGLLSRSLSKHTRNNKTGMNSGNPWVKILCREKYCRKSRYRKHLYHNKTHRRETCNTHPHPSPRSPLSYHRRLRSGHVHRISKPTTMEA